MRIKRRIEFTGKNLNDVFNLPCLKCIIKIDSKPVLVLLNTTLVSRSRPFVEIGDKLVQYDDGQWEVIR